MSLGGEGGAEAGGLDRPALLRALRHDLRTPINHIVGYSDLLGEEVVELGLTGLTDDLARIQRAGRELLRIVSELLDSERLQAGTLDVEQLDHSLRVPLNAVIGYSDLLDEEAAALGQEALRVDLQRINAAGRRLLGLLGVVRELAGGLESGGGGPPEPVPPEGGPPEGGPPSPSPSLAPGPPSPLPATGHLLVVDDDDANRDLLARRLERLGYQVGLAANGRLALEALAGGGFDLVLLDVLMPELDGYQVLERLRADDELRHLPVIVLSASDEVESAIRCIQLGAEDYLPKPCDPVLLRARLEACLEKKRLRDQEQRHLATIAAQAAELTEWNRELETRVSQQVEELERMGRLRRFLAPQLAELVVSSGDERLLESHRRDITVVFCDLRGFTAFAASVEPEELMGVLREYHAALGELIFEYEGTLERFTGDGLMVFFNDPVPIPDAAERAVRMAVAMRARVGELAQTWRRQGYRLGFGVGISRGYATLGQIGFEGHFDYGAIGTVTNLAARLCGEAADGQILVSQRVGLAVESIATLESGEALALKGFAEPVTVLQVVGLV
jgi:adenylate cyclase